MLPMDSSDPLMSSSEREAIDNGAWFAGLSPQVRHDILRKIRVRRVEADTALWIRGTDAGSWMACASGVVKLAAPFVTGRARTLDFVAPGEWFGETAILEGEPYAHDAVSIGRVTVACLSREDFWQILFEHRELPVHLLRLQARRNRKLLKVLEASTDLPVRTRLVLALIDLMERHGASRDESGEIQILPQLNQEELARFVGVSRQRVNLELGTLRLQGIVRTRGSEMVIVSPAELRLAACAQDGVLEPLPLRSSTSPGAITQGRKTFQVTPVISAAMTQRPYLQRHSHGPHANATQVS